VLGLGDPDYETNPDVHALDLYRSRRGGSLTGLPATRAEIDAIADVKLLGADASEVGLEAALRLRKRWRAVHFACHGRANAATPMLSYLALSADSGHDGFLTCLDVFRMSIPADLVVLSACETGKGRIYRTEGIVGLARAFMFAGAPRVLCSLWKVDDQATKALMIKFYELWNPKGRKKGRGAAAALKEAQEYVRESRDKRGKQRWKHPYFWAAWVLWGLSG